MLYDNITNDKGCNSTILPVRRQSSALWALGLEAFVPCVMFTVGSITALSAFSFSQAA